MGTSPSSDTGSTAPDRPGADVARFTTEYDIPEDRIRLVLEMKDGRVRVLWLTRRLCVRIVPQLVKILGAISRIPGHGGGAQPATDNDQRRSQLDALGRLEAQSPVPAAEAGENLLISGLKVKSTPRAILIDFRSGEDHLAQTLQFPEAALRQWLGVLYVNFRKAQWVDDIWPAWITNRGGETQPGALRLN